MLGLGDNGLRTLRALLKRTTEGKGSCLGTLVLVAVAALVSRASHQALISGGVAVRQSVHGIPIGTRFPQRGDVKIANQGSRLVCELAHRVAFEIDNGAGARIARLTVIGAHDVEPVLERGRLK